jgi:leucyl-tRNA synthetase
VPVWVGDYVLVGYATGAVMAVPGGDQRDWNFAKHFNLPIIAVTEGADIAKEADERKDAILINSGFLNGLEVPNAITRAIQELETLGVGEGRINYRLRDAAFGRQRYWGEPIPIYYEDGLPKAVKDEHLPLVLPEVDKFLPTADGEPPLARAADWSYSPLHGRGRGEGFSPLETTTMPGWAGSSWYWLRYMDPGNTERFAGKEAVDYWKQVDLYVGGSEHATGHLLYVRFWTKFLFDRGFITVEEPAQKLVNQGMIQGVSAFTNAVGMTRWKLTGGFGDPFPTSRPTVFVSRGKMNELGQAGKHQELLTIQSEVFAKTDIDRVEELYVSDFSPRHVPIELLTDGDALDIERFKEWRASWAPDERVEFILEADGRFICTREVEKMSKSKYNVVNPDDIIERYGADTLRLYEMFLGPLEQSKPWDTNGIEGTSRFLKKFWNLFHAAVASTHRVDVDAETALHVDDSEPTKAELKVLHATLKKVTEDIEKLSFNTSVSQFMIAVNELGALKCHKRDVLEPLTIALAPFAPHIAEELWNLLGHTESITTAPWPQWQAEHLVEDSFSYPISFNGKTRLQLEFPMELDAKSVEAAVLANPEVQARLEGKLPKKVIVVPKRIVNIVI